MGLDFYGHERKSRGALISPGNDSERVTVGSSHPDAEESERMMERAIMTFTKDLSFRNQNG